MLTHQFLGYNPPPGCKLVELLNTGNLSSSLRSVCSVELKLNSETELDLTHCEVAENEMDACERWTVSEWLFTPKHGVFGLARGWATITGVVLIIILTIMCICALPTVRKSGYFQVIFLCFYVLDYVPL